MIFSTSSFNGRGLSRVAAVMLIAAQVAGAQRLPAGEEHSDSACTDPVGMLCVAVLPVENLSGLKAPLTAIEQLLSDQIEHRGFQPLADPSLATFMRAHRLRYMGGVTYVTARAFREETHADAILVTSLETFREGPRPRVTLHGRLVSTTDEPTILWSDSVGLAGDEVPGLLGLGLITDAHVLLEKAVRSLATSLVEARQTWCGTPDTVGRTDADYRQPTAHADRRSRRWSPHLSTDVDVAARYAARFRPRTHFRSPVLDGSSRYTVAVIPFLNVSERKYVDRILALHFVNELRRHANLTVVEPGMVRERLLATRSIMAGGPSLAVADLFFHQELPAVDLILSGEVFDYQDGQGVPKVDFSLQVFEKSTRRVVWFSRSLNRGDEDVLFFDLRRQYTAHALVTRMARAAVDEMLR